MKIISSISQDKRKNRQSSNQASKKIILNNEQILSKGKAKEEPSVHRLLGECKKLKVKCSNIVARLTEELNSHTIVTEKT